MLEQSLPLAIAESEVLRRQIFCFSNIKDNSSELMFLTGLDTDMWNALWKYLKPSPETVLSVRSAAKEDRLRCPGAGRKPTLNLEDEMLLTLIRLRLGRLAGER